MLFFHLSSVYRNKEGFFVKWFVCPRCGADLVEDVWEELQETEDGGFVFDAHPVYVCQDKCGYMKRAEDTPRIIAQQGDDRLLLLYPNDQGRILDLRNSWIGTADAC